MKTKSILKFLSFCVLGFSLFGGGQANAAWTKARCDLSCNRLTCKAEKIVKSCKANCPEKIIPKCLAAGAKWVGEVQGMKEGESMEAYLKRVYGPKALEWSEEECKKTCNAAYCGESKDNYIQCSTKCATLPTCENAGKKWHRTGEGEGILDKKREEMKTPKRKAN